MNVEKLNKAKELSEKIKSIESIIERLSNLRLNKIYVDDCFNNAKIPESCAAVVCNIILVEYKQQLDSVKKEFEML